MTATSKNATLPCGTKIVSHESWMSEALVLLIGGFAKKAIDNNWRRVDDKFGGYHYYDAEERALMAKALPDCTSHGGYCFLDASEDSVSGMVRLEFEFEGDYCNPKYSFWVEDGDINFDGC